MLTVIIPTHNSEHALARTLATLVPAVMTGTVRDVIVADAGSTDGTAEVVDVAGCEIMVSDAPLAARLKTAAAAARGAWLLFLRPGVLLDPGWVEETAQMMDRAVMRETVASHAAVFRGAGPDANASLPRQLIAVLGTVLRGPHPDQGLLISRAAYDLLGGHRADARDPEADLLRRLGRRRLVTLRSAAVATAR